MAGDMQTLQELRQEITAAVDLLKHGDESAEQAEVRNLLARAREAISDDNFVEALDLALQAQLAARPTTEYLLGRAKALENDGSTAYKRTDLNGALELWQQALEEYGRVRDLADARSEPEIVEAVASTMTSIEADVKAASVESGNTSVDKGRQLFDSGQFGAAKDEFEQARRHYAEAVTIATARDDSDATRLSEIGSDLEKNVQMCLAAAEIDRGTALMVKAEELLGKADPYQAKETYREAQTNFEQARDLSVEHKLEEQKNQADDLIDKCAANIRACTDALMGKRDRVASDEIARVADLRVPARGTGREQRPGSDIAEELGSEYEVLRKLGSGGFGDVYLARNSDKKEVAIKVLRELDKHGEEVFFRELEIWRKLTHRNIVKLLRPRIRPVPLFEMEYLPGGDLGELLDRREGRLPLDEACRIAFDLASGLHYAHETHNVIHTDLKPKNVLLAENGEAKITDWGLGKVASSSSVVWGYTWAYAAPEQIANRKAAGDRTDTHQLGVLLYEMLVGRNPFIGGSTEEIGERVLTLVPEKPSSCLANPAIEFLDDLILRCMEKDPDRRPVVREVRETLRGYMRGRHDTELSVATDANSRISILCRVALLEAKDSNYAELLPRLEQLASAVRDSRRRNKVQNLIAEIGLRKRQGMELGDEAVDDLNELLQWVRHD